VYTSELLQRLKKVKRTAKGWTALCPVPAHDDRDPSLSISEAGGKILVHCFAGCTIEEVCRALGIELIDLFTENNSRARTIEAIYDYTDEKGALLSQVVRYFGKKFMQRQPNGHGGWIWNLDNVRRVLYRSRICARLPPCSSSKGRRMWRRRDG
jgi:hypothetical protein